MLFFLSATSLCVHPLKFHIYVSLCNTKSSNFVNNFILYYVPCYSCVLQKPTKGPIKLNSDTNKKRLGYHISINAMDTVSKVDVAIRKAISKQGNWKYVNAGFSSMACLNFNFYIVFPCLLSYFTFYFPSLYLWVDPIAAKHYFLRLKMFLLYKKLPRNVLQIFFQKFQYRKEFENISG